MFFQSFSDVKSVVTVLCNHLEMSFRDDKQEEHDQVKTY